MTPSKPHLVRTISEFHQLHELPSPEHPLISIVDYAQMQVSEDPVAVTFGYYSIALKRGVSKLFYGQQEYDFDEGVLYFMAPNQTLRRQASPIETERSGWLLLIHPDFFWNTSLAKSIRQYEFFDYAIHEALFLSEKEETIFNGLIENIRQEYHSNIDAFSKSIIISSIETLLNYANRFYHRQFITREKANHQLLERLETLLNAYFENPEQVANGLPTVQYVADQLHVSSGYLGSLLRNLTGQNTQQHIHDKLIAKAKEKLSTTSLSVSEIAYGLGFEYTQSFSKLFKAKTQVSPVAFRQSFH
ncbi:MAG: AraC family transcriptional regulator [Sphingobacteriales bacterium]|nr:MAG: AraC family transcriptional regulator [Sphingobacteriales bacterium]